MCAKAFVSLLQQYRLAFTQSQWKIVVWLHERGAAHTPVRASYSTIAKENKIEHRTAQLSIAALIEMGVVQKVDDERVNHYLIVLPE